MVRAIVAFAVALAVAVVLGITAASYFVMDAWAQASATGTGDVPPLSFGERVSWTLHDIGGMGPMYGLLAGIALLVAFLASGLVARLAPGLRPIVFGVAGAVAMVVLFLTMRQVLGTVGVFGARGEFGMIAQAVVGFIAGLTFATVKPAHAA